MNQPSSSTPSLHAASGLRLIPQPAFARPHLISQAATRPRKFSPQEGRALETLGHAIEYLADEYALECRSLPGCHKPPEIEAIRILMACSREVYFSGKPSPTLAEQLRGWLGLVRA